MESDASSCVSSSIVFRESDIKDLDSKIDSLTSEIDEINSYIRELTYKKNMYEGRY